MAGRSGKVGEAVVVAAVLHNTGAMLFFFPRALVEESVCDYQLCMESNSPESLAHVVFSAVAEGVVAGDERLGVAAASEEEEAEAAEAMEGSALLQEYLKRVTVQVLRGGDAPSSAPLSQAAFGWHQEF